MKKFDLELALAGHPLITRDGTKVIDFKYFEKGENCIFKIILLLEDLTVISIKENGAYYDFEEKSPLDTFLDDSVEWIREPKMGDKIIVGGEPSIFVKFGRGKYPICVVKEDENNFVHNEAFSTIKINTDKWEWPKPKPSNLREVNSCEYCDNSSTYGLFELHCDLSNIDVDYNLTCDDFKKKDEI